MRWIVVLLMVGLNGLFILPVSGENHIMFDKANQMYRNKMFDSAAGLYQQLMNDGYRSPDLYYNAGNAFYRINKIGWAIWCYRKALAMRSDKNYQDNLKLAQRRIESPIRPPQPIFFIRWWRGLVGFLSLNAWALMALISFLVGMGVLFYRRLTLNARPLTVLRYGAWLITLLALCMTAVNWMQTTYHYSGIVIKPDTWFRPESKGPPIQIPEGTEVEFVTKGQVQMVVKLPDGRVGQIEASAFKKL